MTETVTTTATAESTTEPAVDLDAVRARLDDFGRMAIERLVGQVTQRNADVDRLASVGGDRITRLDSMREALANGEGSPELLALHKQIATLQEKLGELSEQRDKALNAQIDAEIATSDVDPKALEESIKVQDATIRQGLTYVTGLYGETVKALVPEMKSRRGGRSVGTGTGGSGKRRLRGFTVYVDDVVATSPDKDGNQKSSFSAAAKVMGLKSVDPLSDHYREQYGNDPEKFPAEALFEFVNEGTAYKVRAVRNAE